ncbi:hypothetical protein chiPu_0009174 [Chiloscyllium punctatum]|uniref:TOG domain-containing protein n=1 Tax=Chiloscyllium punctatum TaxID=137246 RepID=A0A401SK05_CHIPU|nr:hypothetical protein [Chiloscyllium punctatum]
MTLDRGTYDVGLLVRSLLQHIADSSGPEQWHNQQAFEIHGIFRFVDMSEDFTEGKYGAPMSVYCGRLALQRQSRLQAASHVHGYSVKLDWAETEVDGGHPSLDTLQLKNKLKRRMSEILPQKSPIETVHPLKPPLSRSASQRILKATRPIPPIEGKANSPTNKAHDTDLTSGDKNEEAAVGEFSGCSPMEAEEGHAASVTVPDEVKISLQQLRSSAEKKRKLLGASLSQSSFKLPCSDESTFQLLPSIPVKPDIRSLHAVMTPLKRESVTQGLHSDSEQQEPQPPEHCTDQSTLLLAKKDKSEGSSLNQTMIISFRLSTETGPEMNKQESVGDAETENEERLRHLTISKSVQEKMHQKRREEMEQRQHRKERKLKQQLEERLQEITPHRDTVPAQSLPGFPLDSPEGDADMDDEEFLKMHSFTRQEQGLTEALKLLANSDWEIKRKGLSSVRRLARCHQEVLLTKLHAVCLAVTKEVSNLRSKVSRSAILSLNELFCQLKRNMDQEVDEVTRILLHKTGDSNEFIREEAVKALAVMAENVSPSRALTALIAGGVNHRNTTVRKCTAENLLSVVEHLGAERLLSGTKENLDQIVQTMVKFSQDGNQETRFYGRKALNILVSHPEFERYMERSLLSQDFHHIITAIKQRGDAFSDPYSTKGRNSRVNSSLKCQENMPNTGRVELDTPQQQGITPRRSIIRATEAVEQVKQMNKLLSSKEFQERTQGISLLLQHCETNPGFVTSNIVNIFDVFIPRLQDSNKKVNQFALQSMSTMIPVLKDDLHRVIHSIVIVVTDNLNSKNTGIYTAAVHVLDTLIDHIGSDTGLVYVLIELLFQCLNASLFIVMVYV